MFGARGTMIMNTAIRRAASAFVVAIMLAGCTTATDEVAPPGLATPPPASTPKLSANCPQVVFKGFDEPRQAAAVAALADTCRIVRSEAFRQAVLTKRGWLSGCGGWLPGGARPIAPEAINAAYPSRVIDFTLEMGDAPDIAVTRLWKAEVVVEPSRFDGWVSGDRKKRSKLVATLAHEMSHLIAVEGTTSVNLFSDNGNNWLWCPDEKLVSYRIGTIAGKLWLDEQSQP